MTFAARGLRGIPFTVLPFLALWGCGSHSPTGQWEGWERTPLRSAEFFQLWHRGGDGLLLTFGPGGSRDTTGIFVVGSGGIPGTMPKGAVPIGHPLRRVALTSTTHASFISALHRADAVAGCAYLDRLRDPIVAARARSGKVVEIAHADGVDRERVLMLAPEALFTYPYGNQGQTNTLGKVPVIPIAEYLERHPLGRAEWVRAFGLLLGEEAAADSLFHGIEERYQWAVARVPKDRRPAVFFGSSWKGTWSVPAGNSYMARLIADAGGHYLFADRSAPGNIDIDLETVLQVGAEADHWGRILALGRPVLAADVAGDDGRIMDLPAFKDHGCFYANSEASDLFGQAGLEPDVVLLDLIGIFHPDPGNPREPVYFRSVQ